MTDLEITKLCAEAMGYKLEFPDLQHLPLCLAENGSSEVFYNPLVKDAQVLALVKKFEMQLWPDHERKAYGKAKLLGWSAFGSGVGAITRSDLNRAICECVAKMQQAKK